MRAALWPTLILCAISLSGGAACAQAFTPDPVDEAAAKREGAITWYTSTPVRAAQYIATEFERQTGVIDANRFPQGLRGKPNAAMGNIERKGAARQKRHSGARRRIR